MRKSSKYKKLSKKALLRRRRIRRIRALFYITLIILFSITISRIYYNKGDFITTNEINYYISLADNHSRDKGQLNWKEIASIDAAINNEKFCNSNEDTIKNISNYFYEGESNNVKKFEEVIKDIDLTRGQKKDAKKILENLEDISLRNKIEGQNVDKDNFIEKLKEPAIKNYKEYGVLPSIAIAQAILESSWGTSELATKYNNYYGIKADKSWGGAVATYSTNENYNDVITANFRAYNSSEESIFDLGKFLNNNSRYRDKGFFNAGGYTGQANALEQAGYATIKNENGEPIYADLLINLIRENNLMIFDNMVLCS